MQSSPLFNMVKKQNSKLKQKIEIGIDTSYQTHLSFMLIISRYWGKIDSRIKVSKSCGIP